MSIIVGILAVIVVLLAVILSHESGHFIAAKLCGVRVDEFAVGFGPKLFGVKRGETLYAVRAIPAGGFVRMAGMTGLPGESDAGPRNFLNASLPRRAFIIVSGVLANFIFAGICFSVYNATPVASQFFSDEPGYSAGLRNGDQLLQVGQTTISTQDLSRAITELHTATAESQGGPLQVKYRDHSGNLRMVTLTPALLVDNEVAILSVNAAPQGLLTITAIDGKTVGTGDPASLLGNGKAVHISGTALSRSGKTTGFSDATIAGVVDGPGGAPGKSEAGWRLGMAPGRDGLPITVALSTGFIQVPQFIYETTNGLVQLITNPAFGGLTGPNGVAGPVAIASDTVATANRGVIDLIGFIGLISINLGYVNILPIPFLDGGRLLFVIIEAVRRRRMDPVREALVHTIGLAVIILFALFVTISDLEKLWS